MVDSLPKKNQPSYISLGLMEHMQWFYSVCRAQNKVYGRENPNTIRQHRSQPQPLRYATSRSQPQPLCCVSSGRYEASHSRYAMLHHEASHSRYAVSAAAAMKPAADRYATLKPATAAMLHQQQPAMKLATAAKKLGTAATTTATTMLSR